MFEILTGLFDTGDFAPRRGSGPGWTTPLVWLHVTSDIFIWLAYVSIPLILVYFTRRRDLPFPRLFMLFALFILACGSTHLIDALTFEYTIYRFAGLMKLITAIVSWVTVIALIPLVPRVMTAVNVASQPGADTRLHRPLPQSPSIRSARYRDYFVAVAAGAIAVGIRGLLDPMLKNDQIFVVALLAVVFVSWQSGFGPAVLCALIGLGGYSYFFVSPRYSFFVEGFGSQLAIGLFFFCGVACAALGESQRTSQRRAARALATAVSRQEELEGEVARRKAIEAALRTAEENLKRHAEILEQTVHERTADLVAEIEERKQAETEVRQQREFLDAILANVTNGIMACDETGKVTVFNRAAREFHGLTAESLPTDRWAERFDLYSGDGVTPLPDEEIPLVRALHGERVRDVEMVVAPHGGSLRILLASGQQLNDADGHNVGAVVSLRDVTEQREADRQIRETSGELRRTNVELQRSNSELEKFAYIASHDLQEPLRKIQAFGDRLRDRCRELLPENGRDYVDRMLSAAGRMRRLIDDLLTFSRVSTQPQTLRHIDLEKLVREAISDLEVRIAQTEATVRVGSLPSLEADATQMRQLFQNLIANAVKFHRKGVPPVVEIDSESFEGVSPNGSESPSIPMVRIFIRDHGIGFDNKYGERIFEVFQRLYGREEYEGTGVGLPICRKIVERHGGTIVARGREGEGATFVVELPLKTSTPPEGSDAKPS